MVSTCRKCFETKGEHLFYRDRAQKNGRKNICIDCENANRTEKPARLVNELLRSWPRVVAE